MKTPSELEWSRVFFWVQIHGLPLGLMNEKVGVVLGESLWNIKEVETFNGKVAWGKFLRVKVKINVHKPLNKCGRISMAGHEKIMVSFKYERLLDLCYVYGCLDHHETECKFAIEMRMKHGTIVREYGAWIKVEEKLVRLGKDEATIDKTSNIHGNSGV
ncbi:hypothetical protein REPUB_Repub02eG0167000 [Reevesia pubescens]